MLELTLFKHKCFSITVIDSSFDPQSCPTPMCAEDCHFETYPDRCPDCVCVPIVEVPVMPAEGVPHEVLNL